MESGTPQEMKALLEENISKIVVRKSGEVLLEANPGGFFSEAFFPLQVAGNSVHLK